MAEDVHGNRGEIEPVTFLVDDTPPEIDWRIGGVDLLAAEVGGDTAGQRARRWLRRWTKAGRAPRSHLDPGWRALAWGSAGSPMSASFAPAGVERRLRAGRRPTEIATSGPAPRLLVLAPGLQPGDGGAVLGGERSLILLAPEDSDCGRVERLEIRSAATPPTGADRRPLLEIVSTDALGNERRVAWPFAERPRR